MSKLTAPTILSSLTSVLLFSACGKDEPPKIVPPENWQSQLKPYVMTQDFEPAVTEAVYVPIYSHIYYEDNQHQLTLVGTLSIRNTDGANSIIIKSIRYYDTHGELKETLLSKPMKLGPYATADVVVPRTNDSGGSGANFVVEWVGEEKVSEPLIEAVMVSTGSSQSVSFVSRGVVIMHVESNLKASAPPSSNTISKPHATKSSGMSK